MHEFSLHLVIQFVEIYDMNGVSVLHEYDNNKNDCHSLALPTNYHEWVQA